MSENYNYTNLTSKWFELANDTYRTYVKGLIWAQEQALDFTRTVASKTDALGESKGLVEEYTAEWKRGQELLNTTWQEGVKNTNEIINQYRATTNANLDELKARLDELQTRVEETTKSNIRAASKTLEIAKN